MRRMRVHHSELCLSPPTGGDSGECNGIAAGFAGAAARGPLARTPRAPPCRCTSLSMRPLGAAVVGLGTGGWWRRALLDGPAPRVPGETIGNGIRTGLRAVATVMGPSIYRECKREIRIGGDTRQTSHVGAWTNPAPCGTTCTGISTLGNSLS